MQATDKKMKSGYAIGRPMRWGVAAALSISMLGLPASALSDDTTAAAQPASVAPEADQANAANTITLEPGKAKKWSLDRKIKKANMLGPDVADVIPLGPNDLLITGKKPGGTQLIVWDEQDQTMILNIDVTSNIETLRKNLKVLFPDSKVFVEEDNGSLTLHGQVRTLEIAREAAEIAQPYSTAGKVSHLLEVGGGQQVMLQVRFAEVSKSAEAQLGFNFGGTDGVSVFGSNIGPNSLGITPGAAPGAPNALLIPSSALGTASMFGTAAQAIGRRLVSLIIRVPQDA